MQHFGRCIEVGADQVDQQPLMNIMLVVDAVGGHDPLKVWLKYTGYFNRKFLDAQCSVLLRFLFAFPALFDGYRR